MSNEPDKRMAFWTIFYFSSRILALVVHVWAVLIAYKVKGLMWAIGTAIVAFVSDLYWFVQLGKSIGYFKSSFCITFMIMAVLGIIAFFILVSIKADET